MSATGLHSPFCPTAMPAAPSGRELMQVVVQVALRRSGIPLHKFLHVSAAEHERLAERVTQQIEMTPVLFALFLQGIEEVERES